VPDRESTVVPELLRRTAELAIGYLETLPERPVGRPVDVDALRATLGGPLPEDGAATSAVTGALAAAAEPGLVASAGPRYFGFVIGGSVPAALAADWLTSAWDQNAGLYLASPATSVIEEVAAGWVRELLGLPVGTGIGFTTGATMANLAGLAAARHAVLARVGWDVEADGLVGAPPIRVIVGAEAHASLLSALRLVGLGSGPGVVRAPADEQGRMRADELVAALADSPTNGATIVCAQAGNVNSGASDPFREIVGAAHECGAWVHVDGAFGLWAATSPQLRPQLEGVEAADSWATDAHKWLNVPYDCGIVGVADPTALASAMSQTAAYLVTAEGRARDPFDWVPEASRRARATPVYAAIRSLGRRGIQALVERCCDLARRMAERVAAGTGVRILNDVVLNQVLVRFDAPDGGPAAGDARTRAIIAAVQRDGTMWAGGTRWHGLDAMRISVSAWNTTEADIDRSADAILRAASAIAGSDG
jgi:glutamate/tyrosine decarboxylase-like PLP-dependent enzyme